jgi:hypothetical protein
MAESTWPLRVKTQATGFRGAKVYRTRYEAYNKHIAYRDKERWSIVFIFESTRKFASSLYNGFWYGYMPQAV